MSCANTLNKVVPSSRRRAGNRKAIRIFPRATARAVSIPSFSSRYLVALDVFQDAGRNRARRGQDVEMALPLLLEETLSDDTKTIAFQLPQYSADGQPLPAI